MKLIFVYNADSGIFNAVTDSAHKLLSPSTYNCNLCNITHGSIKMKKQWKAFLTELPYEVIFLHKNELEKSEYDIKEALPVLLQKEKNGTLQTLVSAKKINTCTSIDDLITVIKNALK